MVANLDTSDDGAGSAEHERLLQARARMTCNVIDIDLETWQFAEHPPGWGLDE